jgi:hypothetical protein
VKGTTTSANFLLPSYVSNAMQTDSYILYMHCIAFLPCLFLFSPLAILLTLFLIWIRRAANLQENATHRSDPQYHTFSIVTLLFLCVGVRAGLLSTFLACWANIIDRPFDDASLLSHLSVTYETYDSVCVVFFFG